MSSNSLDFQISEYVNSVYPLFSEFLKVYFEYAKSKNNSYYVLSNHQKFNDVDLTDDSLVDKFYRTYGEYLPKDIAYDKRNLLKFLNELYTAKGTEKALKLLFKLVFNSEIKVSYPGDNILRTSAGKWVQDKFFILNTEFGTIPNVGEYLTLFDDTNSFVLIDKVEYVAERKYKVYFTTSQPTNLYDGIKLKCIRDEILVYVGTLEYTLTGISVLEPGASWMNGQIFTIPGSISDTLVKVTSTKNYGQVDRVSIVDYGWQHPKDQQVLVSSYPQKPIGTKYDIEIVGNVIVLSIIDYMTSIDESVIAYSDGIYPDTYCLDNEWNTDFYAGHKAINVLLLNTKTANIYEDSTISMESWLLSRAKFGCIYGPVGKTVGRFLDNSGQLSNDIIKLQDNFYYQAFSYLIETSKDIKDYKELLNITHPAGMMRFSALDKIFSNEFSVDVNSDVSYITNDVYLNPVDELLSQSEKLDINVIKLLEEIVTISELLGITLNKSLIEDSVSTSVDQYISDTADSSHTIDYFSSNYTGLNIALTIG